MASGEGLLDLQRASAGSGKTYTLAKKYIWYLTTIKTAGKPRRLRTDAELADSARHILAVTFTNKATGEMQMRIVDRLFDLAYSKPRHGTRRDGSQIIRKPEYMGDFVEELGESPERIATVCRKALRILLENYSDFNVSTIDSFFQLVLRTLAYEADLSDTYQVEIDSNYLSQVSVDSTLEEINSNKDADETRFWVGILMKRSGSSWNIFAPDSEDSEKFGNSPYKRFVNSVKKLANEDYKLRRDEVESYFKRNIDFRSIYEDLVEKYDTPVREKFCRMRDEYLRAYRLFPQSMQGLSGNSNAAKLINNTAKLADFKDHDFASIKSITDVHGKLNLSWVRNKKVVPYMESEEQIRQIEEALASAEDLYQEWLAKVETPEYRQWSLYAQNLPYLALFGIVTRKRLEYLAELNTVELGETNMILKGIIGDSDAPFIYERLGSILNHFLIDEFQDTSFLQWSNIYPLLSESMSRGDGNNESLIIGDAKQSIYRFRNADPSLITTKVPALFRGRIVGEDDEEGASENTNFRSCRRIVQFNNSFFEFLAARLDHFSDADRMKFKPLYSNVVQRPNKTEDDGYVEINLVKPGKTDKESSGGTIPKAYLEKRIPALVVELLGRGYRQRDIAVLVRTNAQGGSVIDSFVKYNMNRKAGQPEIRFVSEESLQVSRSSAVGMIVGVLENMARGFNPEINEGDDRLKKGVAKWEEIKSNFKFFALSHSGENVPMLMEAFLKERPDMASVNDLISSMHSLAIPAIVEAIVASFVPQEVRRREAVFIAAFQDLVLEYCEKNPTDIGSFLKWWDRRRLTASITSPKDTDAVQVMTIHKAKGLEFDCVIVPNAEWDFKDKVDGKHTEWRWVKPELPGLADFDMPPYMPVETSELMGETTHAPLLYEHYDLVRMDILNTAYVAFTRACRELYLFCPGNSTPEIPPTDGTKEREFADVSYSSIGCNLYECLAGHADNPETDTRRIHTKDVNILKPEDANYPESEDETFAEPKDENLFLTLTFGSKRKDISEMREQEEEKRKAEELEDARAGTLLRGKPEMKEITDYLSTMPDINRLKSSDEESGGFDEIEDNAARIEGSKKHAVLERMRSLSDLPAALKRCVAAGLIPIGEAAEIEEELGAKLADPRAARWFDGSAKVLTERSLLVDVNPYTDKVRIKRPDRVVIYPDGHAEVVDYKFGTSRDNKKHVEQVEEYVRILRSTGKFTGVAGYLWYINEAKIEQIK